MNACFSKTAETFSKHLIKFVSTRQKPFEVLTLLSEPKIYYLPLTQKTINVTWYKHNSFIDWKGIIYWYSFSFSLPI